VIQAGLFSAVTSAFVIQVHSQLQPDPNDETAALLRVLIYKIDNTTFGSDVPMLPQWAGPPRTIVQVEAILYASLATSIFSAFLAMLGKQWLNRYASIDMRGSAIERSQNRQKKLDGIVRWYFHYVMEALPLMLQFALLLLGCGLSLYLWGINVDVASVIVGITSFGIAFYVLIVVAGTASVSCPYQTPGAQILRHTPSLIRSMFRSAAVYSNTVFSYYTKSSLCIQTLVTCRGLIRPERWSFDGVIQLELLILTLPFHLVYDTHLFVRPMYMGVLTLLHWARSPSVDESDQQVVTLDLQCISWILQTSLDKVIHLSTLKSLAAMATLTNFNPALISACFDILAGCVMVVGGKVVITRGLEELAAISDLCCLHAISHLATMDPTSSVLKDVRQRYTRTFPLKADFEGFPPCLSFAVILNISYSQSKVQQEDYRLLSNVHVTPVHLSQLEYQKKERGKVPRWFLRFALHHLRQDPPPPPSVVVDCLSIIAIDMGCTVSDTTTLDERYARIQHMSAFLIRSQGTAGGGFGPGDSGTRRHGRGCPAACNHSQAEGHRCALTIRDPPCGRRAGSDD